MTTLQPAPVRLPGLARALQRAFAFRCVRPNVLRCACRSAGPGSTAPGVLRITVSLAAASADAPARTAVATVAPAAGGAVTCAALRSAAAAALGLPNLGAYALTNGSVADISSDADAAALRPGDTLHVLPRGAAGERQPLCERISFPPHPRVLTDNGDCACGRGFCAGFARAG
jgi:hypothetical protein